VIDIVDTSSIRGYHAHVYFAASTSNVAEALREEIAARFEVDVGKVHHRAIGPHSQPMFRLAFGSDQLATILPWLILNRSGLDILVHPCTDDEIADHTARPLNEEFIARYVASKQRA
jgi:DOPA 4,5-dioxygenase